MNHDGPIGEAEILDDLPGDEPQAPPEGQQEAPAEAPLNPAIVSYYDCERKEYLTLSQRGVYLSLPEASFKRHLRAAGISPRAQDGDLLSPIDKHILETQHERDISYSGRLCGRPAGFYEEGGTRFLVTSGLDLPTPAPGPFPTIKAIIHGLLGNNETHGQTQINTFLGWLQVGQIALRARRIQAAQAMALAGPPGCGKSLLQAIITTLFGGRQAKPHRYMTGATEFNSDHFEAEHLILEDEFMGSRISDRLKLGASIKNICVSSRSQSCHRKGRPAVNLPAWWRLSISLNDDPEALLVLPPLDEHLADKIILLKCHAFTFPMPMDSGEAQERMIDECRREAPGFLHWLLNTFKLPESLVDDRRYGVASWKHPDLVEALNCLSPEASLLALADAVLWTSGAKEWRGTADELERLLMDDHETAGTARKLLEWRAAAGTYLGRLSTRPEPRVTDARKNNRREWIITAPVTE
jgi:hypothetical protein